jgi:hypothetical protein
VLAGKGTTAIPNSTEVGTRVPSSNCSSVPQWAVVSQQQSSAAYTGALRSSY